MCSGTAADGGALQKDSLRDGGKHQRSFTKEKRPNNIWILNEVSWSSEKQRGNLH